MKNKRISLTEHDLKRASEMWIAGMLVADILDKIDFDHDRFRNVVRANRDLFPKRLQNFYDSRRREKERESKIRDEKKPPALTNEMREIVVKLWGCGVQSSDIAKQLGVTQNVVIGFIARNRERCPFRAERIKRTLEAQVIKLNAAKRDTFHIPRNNVMQFTTAIGYKCSLPRVSILEKAG